MISRFKKYKLSGERRVFPVVNKLQSQKKKKKVVNISNGATCPHVDA